MCCEVTDHSVADIKNSKHKRLGCRVTLSECLKCNRVFCSDKKRFAVDFTKNKVVARLEKDETYHKNYKAEGSLLMSSCWEVYHRFGLKPEACSFPLKCTNAIDLTHQQSDIAENEQLEVINEDYPTDNDTSMDNTFILADITNLNVSTSSSNSQLGTELSLRTTSSDLGISPKRNNSARTPSPLQDNVDQTRKKVVTRANKPAYKSNSAFKPNVAQQKENHSIFDPKNIIIEGKRSRGKKNPLQ